MIKDRTFIVISFLVIAFHLMGLLALSTLSPEKILLQSPQRIVVTTVQLYPQTSQAISSKPKEQEVEIQDSPKEPPPAPQQKKKDPPKEQAIEIQDSAPKQKKKEPPVKKPLKSTPLVKKVPSKKKESKEINKKSTIPPDNSKEKALKEKQQTLLAKAKAKMGNIEKTSSLIALSLNTPSHVEKLQIDTVSIEFTTPLTSKEVSYRNALAHRIKQSLKLPVDAEIQLKLTIDRSGRILSLKILHSSSRENKDYIEKNLPKITLPPFGDHFGDDDQYTFTITMSNE